MGKSDYVVSILPTQKEVEDVMMNEEFMESVREDAVIIESSTIDPFFVQKLHLFSRSLGKVLIDAPCSGGWIGAKNATLLFMLGVNCDTTLKVGL